MWISIAIKPRFKSGLVILQCQFVIPIPEQMVNVAFVLSSAVAPRCYAHPSPLRNAEKLKAVGSYKARSHRSYMDSNKLKAWMELRGLQIEVEYAECFEVIRWVDRI